MLAVISHPDCLLHDPGPDHPDRPARLYAINDRIIASGMEFVVRHYDAPLATREQLERAHDPAYVARIYAAASIARDMPVEIDGDTVMSSGTMMAARRAAGAGVLGVDLVMKGEAGPAFCAVRPPGHHAEYGRAMGFCLFNNIAVGAAHALAEYGLERVAIVDFDVHHGNGTEDIFKEEKRVLLCSSFQHPFYPHTGHDSDTPNLEAVPLPAGTDGPAFRKAIAERWLPALNSFRPQFIFVSAGFDGHILDDMSGWKLGEADYGWITREIVSVAKSHADGRIVSMLEGGYEPGALGRSVVAHLKPFLE
jgi:acetoin utilization deacetylase AcuC-like enzyme